MRPGTDFVVMRLAPMIGRPESARRVSAAHYTFTLPIALEVAAALRKKEARAAYWIVRAGTKAHRPELLWNWRRFGR